MAPERTLTSVLRTTRSSLTSAGRICALISSSVDAVRPSPAAAACSRALGHVAGGLLVRHDAQDVARLRQVLRGR